MAHATATLVVSRTYAKRETDKSEWSGQIGATTLEIRDHVWYLDGKELPKDSREYLMNFALQSMQDAYAGAESLTDAVARFEKKRDAIMAGTVGTREGGVDTLVEAGRNVARIMFHAQYGQKSAEWKAFKDLDAKGQNRTLDAIVAKLVAKNADAFAKKVDAYVVEEQRKRDERRAIAESDEMAIEM